MKAILDSRQTYHDPQHFMANGKVHPCPEQPERVAVLKAGAKAAGCEFQQPADAGLGPITAIHSPEYLEFLKNIYDRWRRIDGAGPEVIPNIHPANRTDAYPESATGQAGYHQADTACPIGKNTWVSAYWSAQSAISGAELIIGADRSAYVLSRPPGHHAFADLAGGFCFLNNSAIAAQRLLAAGMRPAILDVDVHHGNGTQAIFYDRADVFTVSLHADPNNFYPFFWGHGHERGTGSGQGYNLNIPLPRGLGDNDYFTHLKIALSRISDFGADVIVVALGLDAYSGDPFKGLNISTSGFSKIGSAIAAAGLPTLFVQEGGYLCDQLGNNLASVLSGFQD